MTSSQPSAKAVTQRFFRDRYVAAVLLATAVCALSLYCIFLTRFDPVVAFVWLPNAVLAAVLMRADPRDLRLYSVAAFIGFMAANIATAPVAFSVGLSVINTLEALAAALLLRRYDFVIGGTISPARAILLLLIFVAVSCLGGLSAAIFLYAISGAPALHNFVNWVVGDTIGAVTLLLPILTAQRRDFDVLFQPRQLAAMCAIVIVAVAFGAIVATYDAFPMILVTVPMVAMCWRYGPAVGGLMVNIAGHLGFLLLVSGEIQVRNGAAVDPREVAFAACVAVFFAVSAGLTARRLEEKQSRVTERAMRLHEAERRLSFALDGAGAVVWEWSKSTNAFFVHGELARWFEGLNTNNATFDELLEKIHAGDVTRFLEDWQQLELNGTPVTGEYRLNILTGGTGWFSLSIFPTYDGRGVWDGVIGLLMDVSERRTAADTLDRERQRFMDFAATASDVFFETDENRMVTGIAAGADRSDRWNALVGRWLGEFDVHERHAAEASLALEAIEEGRNFRSYVIQLSPPEAGQQYARLNGRSMHDEHGRFLGYRGTLSDITEGMVRTLGAAQSEKLLSLGTMAAGLAHEFNNLLSVVLGHADLLRRGIERDEIDPDHVAQITDAARRGAVLSKGLLSFGRKGTAGRPEILDARQAVADLALLLRPILGAQYHLLLEIAGPPAFINVSRDLLVQSIMNLVVNARDAMPGGGPIRVQVDLVGAADKQDVEIRVIDRGTGIDEATQARIFEPFYTTKSVGRGTGLGLPIVHGFATESGGHVTVRSTVGEGSAFTISLPFVAPQTAVQGTVRQDFKGLRALVVDDERPLVKTHTAILEELGFQVAGFDNANDMLAALDDAEEPFDLLVSDVLMPELDGIRGAELALALCPELRVLFVTGQPERIGHDTGVMPAGSKVLVKPFERADLVRVLTELLPPSRSVAA